MRRNGFTMVELIFVIVIIGILSAVALPKFGGVKDKAKINSETSAFNSLDSAIIAVQEFRIDDFNDRNVSWHSDGSGNLRENRTQKIARYATINTNRQVLREIAKKTDNFKIIGFLGAENDRLYSNNSNRANADDVLFIIGTASNPNTGVRPNEDLPNNDAQGKPDNNDFWVFNPTDFDLNITSNNTGRTTINGTNGIATITPQSITLVDINNASGARFTDIRAQDGNGIGPVQNPREVLF